MMNAALNAFPADAKPVPLRSQPRIVVIGGTGATGTIIVAALRRTFPNATIVVASRNACERPRPPQADGAILLDAARDPPQPAAIAALAGFDLAVLALGPFDDVLDRAHRLCIAAGVDCVDINDSPEASRAILALDPIASAANVSILTGMGLNPGLSTLLLDDLFTRFDQIERIEVRLFAGGNEPSGVAATRTMIANFRPHVFDVRNGRETRVEADDVSAAKTFYYPTIPGSAVSFHCSSAESALLQARGDAAPKAHIDYRIHFQGMPPGLVGVFRKSPLLRSPRVAQGLARFFHTMHGRSRERSGNLDRSVLALRAVGLAHDGSRCTRTAFATGATTFGMTAAFAAVVAKAHLGRETGTTPGVLGIGLRTALSQPALIASLQATGIEIRHAEG